jgi:hypothetical protein
MHKRKRTKRQAIFYKTLYRKHGSQTYHVFFYCISQKSDFIYNS